MSPIYILIDTNVLRRLVSKSDFSTLLKRLQHHVISGDVKILCPSILQTEWIKHREEEKKVLENLLKPEQRKVNQRKAINEPLAELEDDKLHELRELLFSQLIVIDELLATYSIKLSPSNELKLFILDWREQRKAPFHETSKDNFNDAELFFSALSYLKQKETARLFFITNNSKQFSDITDTSTLHPDLIAFSENVDIKYFLDIGDAYKIFDESGLVERNSGRLKDLPKLQQVVPVDRSKDVLQQMYDYLTKRFTGWAFLPKKIWARHYPFITGDYFDLYQPAFTLVTDNKAVYELLTQTEVVDGIAINSSPAIELTDANKKMLQWIFNLFHSHFIYNAAFKNESPVFLKNTQPFEDFNSLVSKSANFDFMDVIQMMQSDSPTLRETSLQDGLQKAFAFYKTGNFKKAAIQLNDLRKANHEKKDAYLFLVCFNLKTLAKALGNLPRHDNEAKQIINDIGVLDMKTLARQCSTPANKAIIQYLGESQFYRDAFPDLHEAVIDLRRLYDGRNTGNTHATQELLDYYSSSEQFLSANCIMYDMYDEFKSMTSLFAEGALLSYGCDKMLIGKLQHFTDYMLLQLIKYCKGEDVLRTIRQLELTEIAYNHDNDELPVTQAAINLLEQAIQIHLSFDTLINRDMPYFWQNIGNYIYNSLLIFSFWDFDAGTVNLIAVKLITFIEQFGGRQPYRLKNGVALFIWHNRRKISPELMKRFLLVALTKADWHDENHFETLKNALKLNDHKIEFSTTEFNHISVRFIGHCDLCDSDHSWHTIAYFYECMADENQKKQVQQQILLSLTAKFDPEQYTIVCLYNIIEPSPEWNNNYLDFILGLLAKGKGSQVTGINDFYVDFRIDRYLNFCFRYNLPIDIRVTTLLTGFGKYYTWLANLDEYDYSLFDPDWIKAHFTLYYKRRFRQSLPLKENLLTLMKQPKYSFLAKYIVWIYCSHD